ncbi:MAG: FAD binding domain-containing protein [Candidatus Dormibacterales bacterium]
MFPALFDYRAPASLPEVLDLLGEHGDDAKVMAGGQSLIPLLKLRLSAPTLIVDLGRVPGLTGISAEGSRLRIGARTRHADIDRDPDVSTRCRILADAAPLVSDPLIRNAGTLGGSICHADPAGDWASVMLALDAQLVARSRRGERTMAADGFFQGPFTTLLEPDEVLTEIQVPLPAGRASGTYLKLERKVGDFATVGVAAQIEMDDGRVARAGIGLTAVGPTNIRARRAEESLRGREPTPEAIAEAARLAAAESEPKDDIRGPAEYKRDVVRVFVERALTTAVERAKGVLG